MKPIQFPEANVTFAKDQPEYLPLPAYRDHHDPSGTVISCWKLSWRERIKALVFGRLYLSQMTFHEALQPQLPAIDSPFVPASLTPARDDAVDGSGR